MNKNLWELYKNSERGKSNIELFTYKEGEEAVKWVEKIFKKHIGYFGGEQHESNSYDDLINYCVDNFYLITTCVFADNLQIQENENLSDYFERLIDNIEVSEAEQDEKGNWNKAKDGFIFVRKQDYKTLCAILPEISLALFYLHPDAFFPILFREHFDVLMKSLDILEIQIPKLPAKPDKRGRLLFYRKLTDNIFDFSKTNGLTTEETCACIYDYSLLLLEEGETEIEMPEPTNIWLTGGSKNDYKTFLENPVKGAKSVWTCNENTKRGDIIIMYVLAPYSCIQSIWRADIDGVYTPFNYYNSRTRTTDGILIPHITLNDLKSAT